MTQQVDPTDTEIDLEVGYGRPPKAARFKPGQSGNPKGRPKKLLIAADPLLKFLNEQISVREGKRSRRMTVYEAMLKQLINSAARGDTKSVKMVMTLRQQYATAEHAPDASYLNNVSIEDQAIIDAFVASVAVATDVSGSPDKALPDEPDGPMGQKALAKP